MFLQGICVFEHEVCYMVQKAHLQNAVLFWVSSASDLLIWLFIFNVYLLGLFTCANSNKSYSFSFLIFHLQFFCQVYENVKLGQSAFMSIVNSAVLLQTFISHYLQDTGLNLLASLRLLFLMPGRSLYTCNLCTHGFPRLLFFDLISFAEFPY